MDDEDVGLSVQKGKKHHRIIKTMSTYEDMCYMKCD